MSQGPTGSWAYQGPVNPCQAFQSLYANVAQSRKRLLNQKAAIESVLRLMSYGRHTGDSAITDFLGMSRDRVICAIHQIKKLKKISF